MSCVIYTQTPKQTFRGCFSSEHGLASCLLISRIHLFGPAHFLEMEENIC